MTRVLLTGASGFIGSHVTSHLRRRNFEVHALGQRPPRDQACIFHAANLLDPGQVDGVLKAVRASHLLHLAWYAEPGQYWRSPKNLDWVSASLHLVQSFAANGGQRAVFAGTCAEYEWGSQRLSEASTPCLPSTLYGTSKDALHRLLASYADGAALSIAWGRVFFLYGPGEKKGRLVSDAILALLAGHPFPTSPGHHKRDYLHVDDVAAAFAALTNSDVTGPVNIASGTAVPIRSVLECIAEQLGNEELLQFGARSLAATEPFVIEGDITRLREEVNFSPSIKLRQGIRSTVESWRAQALT